MEWWIWLLVAIAVFVALRFVGEIITFVAYLLIGIFFVLTSPFWFVRWIVKGVRGDYD